ncbi:MAG: hypothetical protein LBR36_07295 [Bacteroidales bacterium]|nr:hypothetical protein [Bacteroidales bacterium]
MTTVIVMSDILNRVGYKGEHVADKVICSKYGFRYGNFLFHNFGNQNFAFQSLDYKSITPPPPPTA